MGSLPTETTIRIGAALWMRLKALFDNGEIGKLTEVELKLVLAYVCHANWVDCEAWPGEKLLTGKLRIHRSNLYAARGRLVESGILRLRRKRYTRGGDGTEGNVYEITVPARKAAHQRQSGKVSHAGLFNEKSLEMSLGEDVKSLSRATSLYKDERVTGTHLSERVTERDQESAREGNSSATAP